MKGRELVADNSPDILVYDNQPAPLTKTIRVAAGQGILERGTVIAFKEDNIGAAGAPWTGDEDEVADCILCDDLDTQDDSGAEVIGHAYRTGHFARQALIFGDDVDEITPEAEQQLRYAGIYLDNVVL